MWNTKVLIEVAGRYIDVGAPHIYFIVLNIPKISIKFLGKLTTTGMRRQFVPLMFYDIWLYNGILVNGTLRGDMYFDGVIKKLFSLRGKETRSIIDVINFLDRSLTLRLLSSGCHVDV